MLRCVFSEKYINHGLKTYFWILSQYVYLLLYTDYMHKNNMHINNLQSNLPNKTYHKSKTHLLEYIKCLSHKNVESGMSFKAKTTFGTLNANIKCVCVTGNNRHEPMSMESCSQLSNMQTKCLLNRLKHSRSIAKKIRNTFTLLVPQGPGNGN